MEWEFCHINIRKGRMCVITESVQQRHSHTIFADFTLAGAIYRQIKNKNIIHANAVLIFSPIFTARIRTRLKVLLNDDDFQKQLEDYMQNL